MMGLFMGQSGRVGTVGTIVGLALTFSALACEPEVADQSLGCLDAVAADPLFTGAILTGQPVEPVAGDLELTGTLEHTENFAIRRVSVAGVAAENLDYNFSRWKVTIPVGTLNLAKPDPATGVVTLAAEAVDVCERRAVFDSLDVVAAGALGKNVTRLALELSYPDGQDYAPTTVARAVEVTVRANVEAAGGVVGLRFDGEAVGTISGAGSVALVADGEDATAQTTAYVTSAGTQLLLGEIAQTRAQAQLRAVGPPALVPNEVTLSAGQSQRVTVVTDGRVERCWASGSSGVSVTSGEADLMLEEGGTDLTGDGSVDIDIAVDVGVDAQGSVTIRCEDVFGQQVMSSYSFGP